MWIKQYLFSSESHQIFVSSMGCFKRDSTSSDSHPTMIHVIVKLCLCLIETLLATEEKDLSTSSTTYDFCVVQDRCVYVIRKNIATENTAYKCNFFWIFWLRWTGSFSKTSGNIRFAFQSEWGQQKGRNNDIRPLWHNRVLCAHKAIVKLPNSLWRLLFEGKIHIFGAHSAKKIHMKKINTVSF